MNLELELKSQKITDGFTSCFCGDAATLLVELGSIEQLHGRHFDICQKEECLDKAFDICRSRIMWFRENSNYFFDMKESA